MDWEEAGAGLESWEEKWCLRTDCTMFWMAERSHPASSFILDPLPMDFGPTEQPTRLGVEKAGAAAGRLEGQQGGPR